MLPGAPMLRSMSLTGPSFGIADGGFDASRILSRKTSPARVGGEDVGELHAGAVLGHHWGHGVAPELVVGGFLVGRRSGRGAVDLDEDEAGRIVGLLQDIEPGDAGFADRQPGVFQTRSFEGFDRLGLHMNMNMNNEHTVAGVGHK